VAIKSEGTWAVGWFYILEAGKETVLFLEGEGLTEKRRYEHTISVT